MREGYWEQSGRNPIIGALIVTMLLGAVYFILQSIGVNLYVLIDQWVNRSHTLSSDLNFFDRMKEIFALYQKPLLIIVMISQYAIFLLPTIWIYRKWHSKNWVSDFKLDHVPIMGILIAIVGTLLFLPLAEWLSMIFFHFFPGLEKLSSLQEPLFLNESPGGLFFLILAIGVTPAICEEILFRGYLQTVLARKFKDFRVILISGVLFSLYHQNAMGLLALTAAGLWLGLLAWRFRSLYVSMVAHFVYNSTIVLIYNQKISGPFFNDQGGFTGTSILLSSILFIALAIYLYQMKGEQVVTGESP